MFKIPIQKKKTARFNISQIRAKGAIFFERGYTRKKHYSLFEFEGFTETGYKNKLANIDRGPGGFAENK